MSFTFHLWLQLFVCSLFLAVHEGIVVARALDYSVVSRVLDSMTPTPMTPTVFL